MLVCTLKAHYSAPRRVFTYFISFFQYTAKEQSLLDSPNERILCSL